MELSFRNTFMGTVSRALVTPLLTEVRIAVGALGELVSVITTESYERLGLAEGETVTALIKPTELFLARAGDGGRALTCNCLPGRVERLQRNGAMAEIRGILDDGSPLCAVNAVAALDSLQVRPGDRVVFYFKSMSLILSADKRLDESVLLSGAGFGGADGAP